MSKKFFKALVIVLWLTSTFLPGPLSLHSVPVVLAEECSSTSSSCPG